jgi:hypothetical protein
MCLSEEKMPYMVRNLLFCRYRCLMRKFFYSPPREVSLLSFSHTVYRLGNAEKFSKIVALRPPRWTSVVSLAYLEFFIGMTSHGLAGTSSLRGWCFVRREFMVCSMEVYK